MTSQITGSTRETIKGASLDIKEKYQSYTCKPWDVFARSTSLNLSFLAMEVSTFPQSGVELTKKIGKLALTFPENNRKFRLIEAKGGEEVIDLRKRIKHQKKG